MVVGTPFQSELVTLGWRKSEKGEKQGSAPALGAGRFSRGQAFGTWRYSGLDGIWDSFA